MNKPLWAIVIFGFIFILAGCQSVPSSQSWAGATVSPDNAVSIARYQGTGTWQGRYLSVDYRYSRDDTGMYLEGKVLFTDRAISNYGTLKDFQLSVLFADANGQIISTIGIDTNIGDFSPFSFQSNLTIPKGTSAISFTYRGTGVPSDVFDTGPVQFFQYPH